MLNEIGLRLQTQLQNWRKPLVCSPTVPRPAVTIPRPKGKLGQIIQCLDQRSAATIKDLMALTGWRRPTVRAALSRLRQRGFCIEAVPEKGDTIYRLKKDRAQP